MLLNAHLLIQKHTWGPQEADTTAKRGAVMGLNF